MITTEPSGYERRTDDRHSVDLAGIVRAYRFGPFETRVIDVSTGGAMIALAGDLVRRGDEVVLAAGGLELVTTIAWITDEYVGLAFHRRLTTAEIAAWRRAGRARAHA